MSDSVWFYSIFVVFKMQSFDQCGPVWSISFSCKWERKISLGEKKDTAVILSVSDWLQMNVFTVENLEKAYQCCMSHFNLLNNLLYVWILKQRMWRLYSSEQEIESYSHLWISWYLLNSLSLVCVICASQNHCEGGAQSQQWTVDVSGPGWHLELLMLLSLCVLVSLQRRFGALPSLHVMDKMTEAMGNISIPSTHESIKASLQPLPVDFTPFLHLPPWKIY